MACVLPSRRYAVVALGGTFDILHEGHEHLLSRAFELGDKVVIGVTSDRLVGSLRKTHKVRPYSQRVNDLRKFLRTRRWSSRATISELNESYGPAASRRGLQALIVSKKTLSSGRRLNELREQRGLAPLDLRVVDLVLAVDGKSISTTRIRDGKIDNRGRLHRREE